MCAWRAQSDPPPPNFRLNNGIAALSNRRFTYPLLILAAAMAFGLFLLLSGNVLRAQDAAIMYAENGTDPVATFTAVDPEGRKIYWSLASAAEVSGNDDLQDTDNADAGEFNISDGVLRFNLPPDFDSPSGGAGNDSNTYTVVVVASDDAPGADANLNKSYEKVVVTVTDLDESGMVTLSSVQPQVGTPFRATLMDEDASAAQITAATWVWERAESVGANAEWTEIVGQVEASYSPVAGVVGRYLRATATYEDEHGNNKTATAVSARPVRAAPSATNGDPTTASNPESRSVLENSPAGTRVGKPVTTTDPNNDPLTYSLTGTDAGNYRIDQSTGQITVAPRVMLDADSDASDEVTVTATDPAGQTGTVTVNIMIENVNESPMITGGPTSESVMENDTDSDTDGPQKTVATYTATDPESTETDDACNVAACVWSLNGADAGDFDISDAGVLEFKTHPNYELPTDANRDNKYMVTVVVTDVGVNGKNKLMAERSVVVAVMNEEEAGMVILSSVQPKVGVALTATLTDEDGVKRDTVKWQWARAESSGGTYTDIEGATSSSYTPVAADAEANSGAGVYLRATAMYSDGAGMSEPKMKESDNAVVADLTNKAPSFDDHSGSLSVRESAMMGSVVGQVKAMDSNDDNLTYKLSGPNASLFEIASVDNPDTTGDGEDEEGQITVKSGTKLDYETKKSYMVTVTATDPSGLSASIDVTIMVANVDEAPTIAGDSVVRRSYAENRVGSVATFTANDPERQSIYWSLALDADVTAEADIDTADNADADHFTINSRGVLSFKSSPDYETPSGEGATSNTYKVVVVASDDAPGAVIEDDADARNKGYKKVVVTVTNVDEPGMVTLTPSLHPQDGVAITATLVDEDANDTQISDATWVWRHSSSRSGGSVIDNATASAYTPVAGVVGRYLRVTATYEDEHGNNKTATAVSARPVRAAPSAANAGPTTGGTESRSVSENSPAGTRVGKPVTTTDPNNDPLTYSLTAGDTGNYRIDQSTGQITVASRVMLDADSDASDEVTVTATDPAGETGTVTVTITIQDVNESPMITGGPTSESVMENDTDPSTADVLDKTVATYTATDPESTETGDACNVAACVWSLKGADAGAFDISNVSGDTFGQLSFKNIPDYESPADANRDNKYMVTVVVTDAGVDGKNKLMAERSVVVTVTNVQEAGEVTLSSVQPKVGVALRATLTDEDGVKGDTVKWQWARSDSAGGTYTDIEGATSSSYTPVAADAEANSDAGVYLQATAMYSDGAGMDQSMMEESANAVVADLTNKAPDFDDHPGSLMVSESALLMDPPMPNVGQVKATDPNSDKLTYSLSGADAGLFNIASVDDSSTSDVDEEGMVTVKSGTKLDYEGKKSYRVTVTAADPSGLSASIDVTIMVTDVNEGPEIMRGGLAISGPRNVEYDEGETDAVATYSATGPMSDMAIWTIEGGADASDFRIVSGELFFRATPNYESPADSDGDNMYMVTLKAYDGVYMDTHDVTVEVMDVEEPVDPLVAKYDANSDGEIQRSEVIAAIGDFFDEGADAPSRADIIRLINLYFDAAN